MVRLLLVARFGLLACCVCVCMHACAYMYIRSYCWRTWTWALCWFVDVLFSSSSPRPQWCGVERCTGTLASTRYVSKVVCECVPVPLPSPIIPCLGCVVVGNIFIWRVVDAKVSVCKALLVEIRGIRVRTMLSLLLHIQ